jgi:hypothetical protein
MNERGQVFTLDMFFALMLTALVVSYSGLALEQARRQAEGYVLRYSLERTANDAADVLLKTLGMPDNWWKNPSTLSILGLAEESANNPAPNTVDIGKFGQLRRLLNKDNWDYPPNANAVAAIKKLFGGSEKFEIRILDENENELWHAFPRWSTGQIGESSGSENSLDVVVVRRLVSVRYGSAVGADSGPIYKVGGGEISGTLAFNIYPGELDAFDFYIVVFGLSVGQNPPPNLKIFVNRMSGGSADYTFVQADLPQKIYPNPTEPPVGHFQHGGVENDSEVDNPLVEGSNYLGFKFTSGPDWIVRVCVVKLPACSDWGDASMFIQPLPATLEVKMWR